VSPAGVNPGAARQERVRRWSGRVVLLAVVALLAQAATFTLTDGLNGLVRETRAERGRWGGAEDLARRSNETRRWFTGSPVASEDEPGGYLAYPPASFVLLWPLIGWLPFEAARGLWAAVSLTGLAWLSALLVRYTRTHAGVPALAAAVLPFSLDGTRVCLANGQLGVILLPAIVTGIVMLGRDDRGWRGDLPGALLVLGALVKPPFAAPFVVVALFTPRRWRPAAIVAGGYVGLTLLALAFQRGSPFAYLERWLRSSAHSLVAPRGSANLASWLTLAGRGEWVVPASVLALAALAVWLRRHRDADVWLLLGVTGVAARIWTYHWGHDDVLILLPIVALVRIAAEPAFSWPTRGTAVALLVATWASVAGLYWQWGLSRIPGYADARGAVWLLVLVFLASQAARSRVTLRVAG